jgi:hypothetical protein
MKGPPLVAVVLHAVDDDIDHELYCQAYGLEMTIDSDWNVDVVLLTPHGHLDAVTKNTAVTGEDTAIVTAGVTEVPLSLTGTPDLSVIDDKRNNWLLVAGPHCIDPENVVVAKLAAALDRGCKVILCFSEIGSSQLPSRIKEVNATALDRLVVAYIGCDATTPSVARDAVRFAQECLLARFGTVEPARIIVGGSTNPERVTELAAIDGFRGILLVEDPEFTEVLEIVEALDGMN